MLRTDVALAEVAGTHGANMLRWMRDPAVRGNLGLKNKPSAARTAAWIANARRDKRVRAFAILLGGRHVGNVVLDEIDPWIASARLSIYIGEPGARGAGVGTAAVRLALREAFGRLGLNRVWLTVHEQNRAAIATYRRLGFIHEGTLRGAFLLKNKRVDALLYSMLAGEFKKR